MRTRGRTAARWISEYLVHGEGDWFGRPFQLEQWQRDLLDRLYEVDTHGERVVRRSLIGLPKGNGKTELAAAVACYELAGGHVLSPQIPVCAASFDQADLVFGAAKVMLSEGPLKSFVNAYDTEISLKDKPGRMFRIAAVAGTSDGLRPTFAVFDELHEWMDTKRARVHLVISNGLAKRRGGWSLGITTAGWDKESLLGRLYRHGGLVDTGEVTDDQWFMWWHAAKESWDLSDPDQLAAAVEEANPASFIPHDQIRTRFFEMPEYEFRRYHLNQWVETATQWLPTGAWSQRGAPHITVPAGTEIVAGFDGSYNNDSTALVGCTLDGHIFVIDVWEKPENDPDWRVPRSEVDLAVDRMMDTYAVQRMECDPMGWASEIETWAERYGEDVVLVLPNTRQRMVPACSRFYAAVVQEELTHDGDVRLARHIQNAYVKETVDGAYITKEGRSSPRKIDLAVAAVIAYDAATRIEQFLEPQVVFI